MAYGSGLKSKLMFGINARLGIPYLYGSTGPNRYDCSGFIWSVFNDAGINFERSSAKTFWEEFEPVEGDERFQFGTLVFFNKLGHVGIVVDENGFYHASSSKGITYSTFKGYWGKRIVGYRRIPTNQTTNIAVEQTKNQ
jgi:cell wall-associated NlpC family hydrolase